MIYRGEREAWMSHQGSGPEIVPEDELQAATDMVKIREHLASFPPNVDSIRHFLAMLRPGFPDMEVQAESATIDGDTIVLTTVWRGTHTGRFVGLPATARRVEFHAVDIVRVVDGKIVAQYGQADYIGLIRQLGVVGSIE